MNKYVVEIYAVDWCGYSEYYDVFAENEEEAAIDYALSITVDSFISKYDLIADGEGTFVEMDNLDDDGELIDEENYTSIDARIHYE